MSDLPPAPPFETVDEYHLRMENSVRTLTTALREARERADRAEKRVTEFADKFTTCAAELSRTESELTALRAERDEALADLKTWEGRFERENTRLRAERDRQREALAPFAAAANEYDFEPSWSNDERIDGEPAAWVAVPITIGHLRAARAALVEVTEDGSPRDSMLEYAKTFEPGELMEQVRDNG